MRGVRTGVAHLARHGRAGRNGDILLVEPEYDRIEPY